MLEEDAKNPLCLGVAGLLERIDYYDAAAAAADRHTWAAKAGDEYPGQISSVQR